MEINGVFLNEVLETHGVFFGKDHLSLDASSKTARVKSLTEKMDGYSDPSGTILMIWDVSSWGTG